jgi:hypothetical protein
MMSTEPVTLEDIIRVFDKLAAARDAEADKRRAALDAEADKRRAELDAEANKRRAEWAEWEAAEKQRRAEWEAAEKQRRAEREAAEEKRRAALDAEVNKQRAEWEAAEKKQRAEREAAEKKQRAEAEKRRAEWEAAEEKRRAERAEREAASEKRWEKHDKRMKALDERYGGLSKNIGKVVEHFFQKALRHEMIFGGIRYNDMSKNLARERRDELQGEFDIVLHNGTFTGLIEVRHVFTLHHLHDFINRIVPNFRELCHDHTDGKTLYLGIASWAFEEGVIEEAKSRGIGILQRDGKKSIIIDDAHLKAY